MIDLRLFEDDSKFGNLYAVIGSFHLNTTGYIIILSHNVSLEIFGSSRICHCVQFSNFKVNDKLRRRINRGTSVIYQDHIINLELVNNFRITKITSMTGGIPFIFHPNHSLKKNVLHQVGSIWNKMFESGVNQILKKDDRPCSRRVQKRILIRVSDKSVSGIRQTNFKKEKIESSLARNYYKSECKQNSKRINSISDKINLREETISFGEDMFSLNWSPEKFVKALDIVKNNTGEEVLSAICAGILMDPSYRLDDCQEFDIQNIIGIASVDVDQLIIKFNLFISNISPVDSAIVSDNELLSQWYDLLAPLLTLTKDATTTFSPSSVETNSNRGGASGDSKTDRNKYIVLPTNGITSEVLNISYKRTKSETGSIRESYEASLIVMKFLFSSEKSIFRNENSIEMLNAAKINWSHVGKQSNESFQVSGGLLFQFLTLFLVSSRGNFPIRVSLETYGGKKRGAKVMWKVPNDPDIIPSNALIKEVYTRLCLSEDSKIAFQLKKVVRGIMSNYPGIIDRVSTSLGLGCDARGKQLENGHPSFLVCQPSFIKEIEESRIAATDQAFIMTNKTITKDTEIHNSYASDLSKQTRSLAKKCDQNENDFENNFSQLEETQENHSIRTR